MPNKIAVSSYSFHRFGQGPEGDQAPSLSEMIDACVEYGIDGLEILAGHLTRDGISTLGALNDLKRHAALCGISLVSVSASHNFVTPDPTERTAQVDLLCDAIDAAASLGAPFVRAFGGRWNTLSWPELIQAGGVEPPRDGFTDDDGYAWSVEAFRAAAHYAGRRGVVLVLENHWGLTGTPEGVLRIVEETGSPWLKVVLDTGNFVHLPDQYAAMAQLLPHLALVHAKTYAGGGFMLDIDLDYKRIAGLLQEAGYNGWLSIEFEGKAHPNEGIPTGVAELRAALGL
ncbi:MAG: sugar phosphate isomerase/epimerase [Chloroflexota bacterium]|nr:sugar phosphate isomerase/epimerase [Chloroflexota bacterium]